MHDSSISGVNLEYHSNKVIEVSGQAHFTSNSKLSPKSITTCPNCGFILTSFQQISQQENSIVCIFCQKHYTKISKHEVSAF